MYVFELRLENRIILENVWPPCTLLLYFSLSFSLSPGEPSGGKVVYASSAVVGVTGGGVVTGSSVTTGVGTTITSAFSPKVLVAFIEPIMKSAPDPDSSSSPLLLLLLLLLLEVSVFCKSNKLKTEGIKSG